MSDENGSTDGLRSRAGLVGAAVVLVLLLAMGLFVGVMAIVGDEDDETAAPPASTSEGEPTDQPSDPDESVCGLPGNETEGNLSTPPEAEWDLIGKVAVPSSDSAGPGVVEDSGVRYCYARTPEGAVFMAANTLAWDKALAADPRGVIENSIAAGPGRDAILAEAESGAGTSGSSETFLQLRGFRLLAYDGSTAMVDLALQAADGTYVHLAYELVWEDGDWRLRLSPDGSLPPAATLPDLTGYVRWAGA